MNVLSLFDGCSGARLALTRANKKIDKYYTCEIDKYSSMVTKLNFPDTIALGDVTKVNFEMLPKINFLVGGSPCTDLSFAKGNGKGLEGEQSKLFYKYFEAYKILKRKNPDLKFLLENVKMKQKWKDIISDLLGVQPIFINSADFSPQQRQRLYWTNIPVDEWTPCEDKLQDILETEEDWYVNRDKAYTMTATYSGACPRDYFEKSSRQLAFTDREKSHCIDANYFKGGNLKSYFEKHRRQLVFNRCLQVGEADIKGRDSLKRVYSPEGKGPALTTCGGGHREPKVYVPPLQWRKLTVRECEALQTVPRDYTAHGAEVDGSYKKISNTRRYKALGNGWTTEVIIHILTGLIKTKEN